nr:dephospho-CoA kinase [Bacteroidota bacterium]
MLKIGLTGNIGSGKTIVAEIFNVCGIPVFDADLEAKKILNSPDIISRLLGVFGKDIILNGLVDRKALANIVFSDPDKLAILNAIVHPHVRQDFQNWCTSHEESPFVIYEAAIILESGFARQLDSVVLVTAPEPLRISRVINRDGVNREDVAGRIKNQLPEGEKIKLADFIINNDGSELLIPQVLRVIQELG